MRLFARATRRVRCLTVQTANPSPFSVRGDGRKESPSFPLSRRAKREGGEDVNFNYVAGVHGLTDPGTMRRILTPIILEADMPNIMDMIIEEGIQKGLEEGIQKGREEMIRTLLAHGAMTPEQIASMFGIDLERVRKISEQ